MIAARLFGPGVQRLTSGETGIPFDAIAARGLVFTCWTPSPEELELLKSGLPVWLIQRGPFIPDMSMRVGKQEEVIPHNLIAAAVSQASGQDPHEVAVAALKVKPIDRWLFRAAVLFTGLVILWVIAAVLS